MANPLKLMCVLAHPDDESLGVGGTIARYSAEGVETYLVTATKGERGWPFKEEPNPGPATLGRIRMAELLGAAPALGLRDVSFLDYMDGELDQADPAQVISKIVGHLRRVRPQVVVTFGPEGGYGHPDHIAICQFTTAAVVCAADASFTAPGGQPAHRVAKLYYRVFTAEEFATYESVFGDTSTVVDDQERRAPGWPEWAITTRIATADHWRRVWEAVACHQTQLPTYAALEALPEERHRALWGDQAYYRAFSTVNGGRQRESDLFEGLR